MFQAFVHPSSIKIAYIVLLAKRKKKIIREKEKKTLGRQIKELIIGLYRVHFNFKWA
jgi:hypothetical protein